MILEVYGAMTLFFDKETVFLELPLLPHYPVRNNAPLGFESQRLEFLTEFTSTHNLLCWL